MRLFIDSFGLCGPQPVGMKLSKKTTLVKSANPHILWFIEMATGELIIKCVKIHDITRFAMICGGQALARSAEAGSLKNADWNYGICDGLILHKRFSQQRISQQADI